MWFPCREILYSPPAWWEEAQLAAFWDLVGEEAGGAHHLVWRSSLNPPVFRMAAQPCPLLYKPLQQSALFCQSGEAGGSWGSHWSFCQPTSNPLLLPRAHQLWALSSWKSRLLSHLPTPVSGFSISLVITHLWPAFHPWIFDLFFFVCWPSILFLLWAYTFLKFLCSRSSRILGTFD